MCLANERSCIVCSSAVCNSCSKPVKRISINSKPVFSTRNTRKIETKKVSRWKSLSFLSKCLQRSQNFAWFASKGRCFITINTQITNRVVGQLDAAKSDNLMPQNFKTVWKLVWSFPLPLVPMWLARDSKQALNTLWEKCGGLVVGPTGVSCIRWRHFSKCVSVPAVCCCVNDWKFVIKMNIIASSPHVGSTEPNKPSKIAISTVFYKLHVCKVLNNKCLWLIDTVELFLFNWNVFHKHRIFLSFVLVSNSLEFIMSSADRSYLWIEQIL